MPRKLPKNVYSEVTRHGKRVYYFRRGRGLRVRLPDIASIEFRSAIERATSIAPTSPPRIARPNFKMLHRQRVGLTIATAVSAARKRAIDKRVPFDLDEDWALRQAEAQSFKCGLTGIPFYMDFASVSKVHPFTPSLDRISPRQGYTRENVRIVIYAMNVMLHDWGIDVFERVISGYRYIKGTKTRTSIPTPFKKVRTGTEKRS